MKSLVPKFAIDPKRERIYVTDEWVSNGHWLVRKLFAERMAPVFKPLKAFLPLLAWKNGKYENGGWLDATTPDLSQAVPSTAGYEDLRAPVTSLVNEMGEVWAYVYKSATDSFEIGLRPQYAPLLRAGEKVQARNGTSPIVVYSGGDIVTVVSPVRLS